MRSPIEVALHQAIVSCVPAQNTLYDYWDVPGKHRAVTIPKFPTTLIIQSIGDGPANKDPIEDRDDSWVFGDGDNLVSLYSGLAVGSYKLDLFIEVDRWRMLAIECDGHDFHDRTKQQAAYDRARDRELLRFGVRTIRFTGSEIHHCAERCASEVWSCLSSMVDVHHVSMVSWQEGYNAALDHPANQSRFRFGLSQEEVGG